ncbi:MAG: Clp protease N-terminal domain-containing protein, partial [Planctomycetota bacterium]
MFQRFAKEARQVVRRAVAIAWTLEEEYVEPEHLLAALLEERTKEATAFLDSNGIDPQRLIG